MLNMYGQFEWTEEELFNHVDKETTKREFSDLWVDVLNLYKYFEFKYRELSDDELYAEIKYVVEQFRKYVSNKRPALMSFATGKSDIEGLKKYIEGLIADMPDKPDSDDTRSIRPKLALIRMKTNWLNALRLSLM